MSGVNLHVFNLGLPCKVKVTVSAAFVFRKVMATESLRFHELKISTRADDAGQRAPLLLLVEDHDDTRELYRYVLEKCGYRIIEARDGEEAISMASAALPDLILMDSILPRVDGVMAAIRIRQIAALHDVPIVFVSGQAEARRQTEALAAGGDEFLVKPVNLNCLEAAIERQLLRRTNGVRTIFAQSIVMAISIGEKTTPFV